MATVVATVPVQMLTTAQAAAYLGRSPRTLQNWRNNLKTGPKYSGRGKGIRYHVRDLDAWIKANTQ
jgi:hypothetical protein